LTSIATFFTFVYVPLNLMTSLFSMNFTVFGTGKLHIWIWIVVTLVVFLVSSTAMYLFVLKRNQRWRHCWPFQCQWRMTRDEKLEMEKTVREGISRGC